MRAMLGPLVIGLLVGGGIGCGRPAPEESPPAAPAPAAAREQPLVPKVQFSVPTRRAATPAPVGADDPALAKALSAAKASLKQLVDRQGRNPQNPWAIAHAMLVFGPEMTIPGYEQPAVDFLAEHYGEPVQIGQETLWTFPSRKGDQLVDVHTDLLLKGFTEGGLAPDREVVVDGQPTFLGALYRRSLYRAWANDGRTGFRGHDMNDVPWALQALTAWAPTHLEYRAENGQSMRLQDLTRELRQTIARETRDMKAARDAGQSMKKDIRQGFFKYTCGGQHMLQGLAYAVGRGFGNDADRHEVCEQIDLLGWRTDVELGTVDPIIATSGTEVKILLHVQRLKYLGHTLETVHKAAAMGVCELTDEQRKASRRVAAELVETVEALDQMGAFTDLDRIARDPRFASIRKGGGQQVVLDLIGDAAHAVRGIDMATGEGTILY